MNPYSNIPTGGLAMIFNRTMNGSVPESRDIDKLAKKYADTRSGSSAEPGGVAAGQRIVVKDLAQVRVVKGRLQSVKK